MLRSVLARILDSRLGGRCIFAVFAGLGTIPSNATTLGFENFAPPGGLININPAMPYTESGYQLTPSSFESAVFDSGAGTTMPGNPTDWFGFAETNAITLTRIAGPPFDLIDFLTGPSTLASAPPIRVTLVGTRAGGGTLNATFVGLTTATTETLNWTDLANVVITTTDDAGPSPRRWSRSCSADARWRLSVRAAGRRRALLDSNPAHSRGSLRCAGPVATLATGSACRVRAGG